MDYGAGKSLYGLESGGGKSLYGLEHGGGQSLSGLEHGVGKTLYGLGSAVPFLEYSRYANGFRGRGGCWGKLRVGFG